jgi:hypothetical protein
MTCRRVGKIIKRFARNSDDVRLVNFKRVRGVDCEWKLLRRPAEHNLSNLAPFWSNWNFGTDSSDVVAVSILKRKVNIAICFHFCVNDAAGKLAIAQALKLLASSSYRVEELLVGRHPRLAEDGLD